MYVIKNTDIKINNIDMQPIIQTIVEQLDKIINLLKK